MLHRLLEGLLSIKGSGYTYNRKCSVYEIKNIKRIANSSISSSETMLIIIVLYGMNYYKKLSVNTAATQRRRLRGVAATFKKRTLNIALRHTKIIF